MLYCMAKRIEYHKDIEDQEDPLQCGYEVWVLIEESSATVCYARIM